jgi:pimeloyl-ACP methyl ester carboxylesterase
MASSQPVPFTVKFDKADIADLRSRLKATRWPTEVENVGWSFGAPLSWVKSLASSLGGEFDFAAAEARLNQFGNFKASIGATLPPLKKKKKKKKSKRQGAGAAANEDASVRLFDFFFLFVCFLLLLFPSQPRRFSFFFQKQASSSSSPRSLAPLEIHFIHQRANRDRPAAPPPLPLLLLHGWPGSVVEFLAVIGPLSDPGPENPTAQAFDVVVPSLPGFGFSEAPREAGWGIRAMASCFNKLMTNVLRYETYCVQGGDWGSMIARRMALDFGTVEAPPGFFEKIKGFFSAEKLGGPRKEDRLIASSEEEESAKGGIVAVHQNMAVAAPRLSSPRTFLQILNAPFAHVAPIFITKDEAKGLKGLLIYQTKESGYFKIQSTKPMTLGYGLSDSPVAALAWVSVRMKETIFLSFFSPFLFSLYFSLPLSLSRHFQSPRNQQHQKTTTGEVPRLGRLRPRPLQGSRRRLGSRSLLPGRHSSQCLSLLVREQGVFLREDLQGGGAGGRDQAAAGRVRSRRRRRRMERKEKGMEVFY